MVVFTDQFDMRKLIRQSATIILVVLVVVGAVELHARDMADLEPLERPIIDPCPPVCDFPSGPEDAFE